MLCVLCALVLQERTAQWKECVFSPVAARLALTDNVREIGIYSLASGGIVKTSTIRVDGAFDLVWNRDGTSLAWRSDTGRASVWHHDRVRTISRDSYPSLPSKISGLTLSADGKRVFVGMEDGVDEVLVAGGVVRSYRLPQSQEVTLARARQGYVLAGGNSCMEIDETSQRVLHRFATKGYVSSIAPSPNGQIAALLEFPLKVEVQTVGKKGHSFIAWSGNGYPGGICWSPNGKYVALVYSDLHGKARDATRSVVLLLRATDWHVVAKTVLPDPSAGRPSFSSSSAIVAVAGNRGVSFWAASTLKPIALHEVSK